MLVKLETQARKKAKLTRYLDVIDFQIILLTLLVLPTALWMIFGLSGFYTIWGAVGYVIWMGIFKIGKPAGYWTHWLSFQFRGRHWTGYNGTTPTPVYYDIRRKE
jgi:hypothetical protein